MTSPVLTGTPTQTVQAFLDAFARHDVDAAMATVDPRVSVTVHRSCARPRRGLAAHGPRRSAARFPDLMISVRRVITTGDVVTALLRAEGTQRPATPGPSTRKSISTSSRPGGSRPAAG